MQARRAPVCGRPAAWKLVVVTLVVIGWTCLGTATAQEIGPATDPEAQPRTTLEVDFVRGGEISKLATEGDFAAGKLRLSDQGIELAPGATGQIRVGRLTSSVQTFDFPANAVSVLWRDQRPPATHIEIEVSVSRNGNTWSRWYGVLPDPHSTGLIRKALPDGRANPNHGFVAGGLLSWGLQRYGFFRYRVTLAADGDASPSLEALRFFYQDSSLGGLHQVIAKPVTPRLKAGGLVQPTICDRACWAARAPQCSISQMSGLDRAVIHHTATQTDWTTTSSADSAAHVRAHQNFHMDGRGWCDLGYNFLVDKLGNSFEGREGSISSLSRAAHDGINDNSIGVALMGYLHSPHNQVPPQAMRDAAYDVIAWKVPDPFDGYGSSAYGTLSGIGYLAGHRDVKATACPGDQMYSFIGTNFTAGDARDGVHTRITGPVIPCCPETPTLGSVTSDGSGGSITVDWNDVGLVANYLVYASSDGTSFAAPVAVASGTTSYTETGLASGQARYYKVTAMGGSQESAPCDVYGAVAGASPSVLIVDGNDRWNFQTSENPSGANHDFAVTTGVAMAGTSFDTADNAGVENGSVALGDYSAVVWLLGEESTAQETFSSQEQTAVTAYLDAGGALFVSGAEIGWDLVDKGGSADQAFYQNYLKASYVSDAAATYDVDMEAGGLYDGLGSVSFSGGVMNVAYPDEIAVSGGSQADLRYATGDIAGVSYNGAFRVVHLGFPLEAINSASDRSAILGLALGFLLETCTVVEDFEAGATGWFIDGGSTCTKGDYVVGDPSLQANSGVTTQVGGSNSGTGSVFTASNTSAGVNDVDGGNCVLGSPTWSVSTTSVLSVAWWHGQRDTGDDATGDFFRLEYSLDGGANWTTLRSNGDARSNAAWAVATAAVPAGSSAQLRVQCSDGAVTGDLVECGIDDVRICH